MFAFVVKNSFRRFANATPKHRKTVKILNYFDRCHGYEPSAEVSALRVSLEERMKTPATIGSLDIHLCSRLRHLNTDNILSLLNIWGSHSPQSLSSSVFYEVFLKSIRKGLWKSVPWNQLVQIIHFVGYRNGDQDSKSLMILFLHTVNDSTALLHSDYRDVCIICEAAFRTSTAVSSPSIRAKILNILKKHAVEVTNESIWLVMLVKMMIFSKFYDLTALREIASDWVSSKKVSRMPFTVQCYVMSLFANASLRSEKLMSELVLSAGRKLQEDRNSVRIKDVSMMLWSLSHLGISLHPTFVDHTVVPILQNEVEAQSLRRGLSIILQCCISLWILGRLPRTLCDKILTLESLHTLKDKTKNYRDLSRFALLLDIINSESPGTLNAQQISILNELSTIDLLTPDINKEVEKRPFLVALQSRLQMLDVDSKIEYLVPRLFVAGVSFKWEGTQYHADVLDWSLRLVDSLLPSGRAVGKARLLRLQSPSIRHVLLQPEKIEEITKHHDWMKSNGFP